MRLRWLILVSLWIYSFVTPRIGICQQAIEYYKRGMEYRKAGILDSAMTAFAHAVAINPNYAEAYLEIGDIYFRFDQYVQARVAYERAIQNQPESVEAYLGLGNVYWYSEGKVDSALYAYRKAMLVDPNNAYANYYTGKLLTITQEHFEAIEYLERAAKLDPNFAAPHESLGLSYMAIGQYEKARIQWQAVKQKGGFFDALIELNRNILSTVAENGILFTNGDADTYPIWYLQEVEEFRKDVTIVNLSLLNTRWYIKLLRDFSPKIRINYSDEYIDNILCVSTPEAAILSNRADPETDLTKGAKWKTKRVEAAGISWDLPAAKGDSLLRVQDVMVFKIIEWNNWERPVYFAITVSKENTIGLDKYLTVEGLAWHLNKKKEEPVQIEKTWEKLRHTYRYDHINDKGISINVEYLLSNYLSVSFMLADALREKGKYDKSIEILEWADTTGVFRGDVSAYEWAADLACKMGQEKVAERFIAKTKSIK